MFWDKGWGLEADLDEPTHASDELRAKTLPSMISQKKKLCHRWLGGKRSPC